MYYIHPPKKEMCMLSMQCHLKVYLTRMEMDKRSCSKWMGLHSPKWTPVHICLQMYKSVNPTSLQFCKNNCSYFLAHHTLSFQQLLGILDRHSHNWRSLLFESMNSDRSKKNIDQKQTCTRKMGHWETFCKDYTGCFTAAARCSTGDNSTPEIATPMKSYTLIANPIFFYYRNATNFKSLRWAFH